MHCHPRWRLRKLPDSYMTATRHAGVKDCREPHIGPEAHRVLDGTAIGIVSVRHWCRKSGSGGRPEIYERPMRGNRVDYQQAAIRQYRLPPRCSRKPASLTLPQSTSRKQSYGSDRCWPEPMVMSIRLAVLHSKAVRNLMSNLALRADRTSKN